MPCLEFRRISFQLELTERWDRPVTTFNIAMGSGEGLGFARDVIEANKAQARTFVIDLYSNDQGLPSVEAQTVARTSILRAYTTIAQANAEFVKDWLFDGALPRINLGRGATWQVERFLKPFAIRRRDNGDVVDLWIPEQGNLFRGTQATSLARLLKESEPKGPHPTLLPEYVAYLQSQKFNVVLTLIPHEGSRPDEARRTADQIGRPFILVDPKELQTLDGGHLIAGSRDIATQRLIDGWLGPAIK